MINSMVAFLSEDLVSKLADLVILLIKFLQQKYKDKQEAQQQNYQLKRNELSEIYHSLYNVISLFPNCSPNDICARLDNMPFFSFENFDAVLTSINYQIEDLENQLKRPNLSTEQYNNIKASIFGRKYSIDQIQTIQNKYITAKKELKEFCNKYKAVLELYAGKEVLCSFELFESTIHNTFISGLSYGDPDDIENNAIDIRRKVLIQEMRIDLGIK